MLVIDAAIGLLMLVITCSLFFGLYDLNYYIFVVKVFSSRDEMVNWARDVGKGLGYVLVIMRSDSGGVSRKVFLTLGCERSGNFRGKKQGLKRVGTTSRKCNFPSKLRGRLKKEDGTWKLTVLNKMHNHEPYDTLEGHAFAARLSNDEKKVVGDMSENRMRPRYILDMLRAQNPDCLSKIRSVYNTKYAHKKSKRGTLTEMQHLTRMIEEYSYAYWTRVEDETKVVKAIFWSHPNSTRLFNQFPTVVLIDSTYKTNRYRIPLLEMVGVTSTNMTFTIAFGYMTNETEPEVDRK